MYIPKEEIAKAKQMDLLTYLMNYEPENLKKESANSYCTVEHDSLKISKARKDILEYNDNIFSSVDYIIDVTRNENISISSHKLEMSNKYLYSIKIDKNDATNLYYFSVESSDDALCQNIVTEIVNLVR